MAFSLDGTKSIIDNYCCFVTDSYCRVCVCVRYSWVLLENILETLDAALEPILLQQKFKQGGQEMMKIGDNVIPYNDIFKFFMT